jgi:hypothetical protein
MEIGPQRIFILWYFTICFLNAESNLFNILIDIIGENFMIFSYINGK